MSAECKKFGRVVLMTCGRFVFDEKKGGNFGVMLVAVNECRHSFCLFLIVVTMRVEAFQSNSIIFVTACWFAERVEFFTSTFKGQYQVTHWVPSDTGS